MRELLGGKVFFFEQKTAYEVDMRLEFRRVLFRSSTVTSREKINIRLRYEYRDTRDIRRNMAKEWSMLGPVPVMMRRSEERRVGKDRRYGSGSRAGRAGRAGGGCARPERGDGRHEV